MDFENTEEDFPGLSGTSKAKKDDPECKLITIVVKEVEQK